MSTNQQAPSAPVTPRPPRLTPAEFDKMGHAFTRLQEIKEATIKHPNDEAEVAGILDFLSNTFISHGGEFLGAWAAVRNEYEPLCNAVSHLFDHVQGISRQRRLVTAQAVGAAQQEQVAKEFSPKIVQP